MKRLGLVLLANALNANAATLQTMPSIAISPQTEVHGAKVAAPGDHDAPIAEPTLRDAVIRAEHEHGTMSKAVADAKIALAKYLDDHSRLSEAEQSLRAAIAILSKVDPSPSATMSDADTDLSDNLRSQGRFLEAESLARAAQDIDAKLAPDGTRVAFDLRHVGLALHAQARFAEADTAFRRALEIRVARLGEVNEQTSISLSDLAENLWSLSQFSDAEAFYRRALNVDAALFGQDDDRLAPDLDGIAGSLQKQSRYADAEPFLRHELAIHSAADDGDPSDIASDADDLANNLANQGRFAEAEPFLRLALRITETSHGPTDLKTSTALGQLAENLDAQGMYDEALAPAEEQLTIDRSHVLRNAVGLDLLVAGRILSHRGAYRQAEARFREALAIFARAPAPVAQNIAVANGEVGDALSKQGRYADAQPYFEISLSQQQAIAHSPDDPAIATARGDLGLNLAMLNRYDEAEQMLREQLRIDEMVSQDGLEVANDLEGLARTLNAEGRFKDAEAIARRALAIRFHRSSTDHPDTLASLGDLASSLHEQERFEESAGLYRQQFLAMETALGPNHPATLLSKENLATSLADLGRNDEAEQLFRELVMSLGGSPGPMSAAFAHALSNLASLLDQEDRTEEALPLAQRAADVTMQALGQKNPETLYARQRYGQLLAQEERIPEAVSIFREVCKSYKDLAYASYREVGRSSTGALRDRLAKCYGVLAHSLWRMRSTIVTPSGVAALEDEAFEAAQLAVQSDAGDALSQSGALTLARSTDAADLAMKYETSVTRQQQLIRTFTALAADANASPKDRSGAAKALNDSTNDAQAVAARLGAALPKYWNLRAPAPVSLSELGAGQGRDSDLLNDDEALVLILVRPEADRGMVFAVSKTGFAWSELAVGEAGVEQRVRALRLALDPRRNRGAATRPYDRAAAYDLYRLLFGSPDLQAVIAGKTLLIVTSGALTRLPFTALVTQLPKDQASGSQADNLRSTAWLIRDHAVAIMPTASTLRVLRSQPASSIVDPRPFLAIADPLLRLPSARQARPPIGRGLVAPQPNEQLAMALAALPPLPGARRESERLKATLGTGREAVLLGPDASKSQLLVMNSSGELSHFRVIEFATHTLSAGFVPELKEQALVMSAGAGNGGTILSTSDAASLHINADWVLLSACESAGADEIGGQEFSGLARAFFYAGARSLLVTYWPIRDDIAGRLVPNIFGFERSDAHLSRAKALQKAALAIAMDRSPGASDPASWANFTLVGEPGR